MTLQLINTAFAGATLIVIAVTALAATVQLRHLRASNQLVALTTVLNDWQRTQLQEWMRYVRFELPNKLNDADFVESLKAPMLDRTQHPELLLADYFEVVGCCIKRGLLERDAYVDAMCGPVLVSYRSVLPVFATMREATGSPAIYENFEYLATECLLWLKRHPAGCYPKRFPHFADEDLISR